ncbi:MAG TPA: hypothetical protein VHS97_08410, partial [Isosphaeraceae bacterium]|nr:hypothetical protein [Isosphaeraceae bacterium]
AAEAIAARCLRRDSNKIKHGKPADLPKKRAVRTKPRTTGTDAAQTVTESAELVNAGSGPNKRDGPDLTGSL